MCAGLSRHTVTKYVNDASPPKYNRESLPFLRVLQDHKERLQALYEYDLTRPERERRTAVTLYEQLILEGYTGSYYSVRRYINAIKRTELEASAAFISMGFPSGDTMQFDWSEEHVVLGGTHCKIKIAHFRLSHSRKLLIVAYLNERQEMLRQEMLMNAFVCAFEFYGGVPKRVIIDNPKTMVIQVLHSKERNYHLRFMAMMNHETGNELFRFAQRQAIQQEHDEAKQSKAKQSKAKQSKAKQSKASGRSCLLALHHHHRWFTFKCTFQIQNKNNTSQ